MFLLELMLVVQAYHIRTSVDIFKIANTGRSHLATKSRHISPVFNFKTNL